LYLSWGPSIFGAIAKSFPTGWKTNSLFCVEVFPAMFPQALSMNLVASRVFASFLPPCFNLSPNFRTGAFPGAPLFFSSVSSFSSSISSFDSSARCHASAKWGSYRNPWLTNIKASATFKTLTPSRAAVSLPCESLVSGANHIGCFCLPCSAGFHARHHIFAIRTLCCLITDH